MQLKRHKGVGALVLCRPTVSVLESHAVLDHHSAMTNAVSVTIGGRSVEIHRIGRSEARGGTPILFFGGTPNSRLLTAPDGAANDHGVDLISFDRPGYGRSTAVTSMTWSDAGDTGAAVVDALGIETCGVIGWTGGAGHAVHTAARLGDRCVDLTIVGGLGSVDDVRVLSSMPPDSAGRLKMLRRLPLAVRRRLIGWTLGPTGRRFQADPAVRLDELLGRADAEDSQVLARPEVREIVRADAAEGFAQASTGWELDALLLTQAWEADLDLKCPTAVWHGTNDVEVRSDSGVAIAERLGTEIELIDGGHYVLFDVWPELFGATSL